MHRHNYYISRNSTSWSICFYSRSKFWRCSVKICCQVELDLTWNIFATNCHKLIVNFVWIISEGVTQSMNLIVHVYLFLFLISPCIMIQILLLYFSDKDLWVLAIGRNPDTHQPLRPHVKYIGNMHGNEVTII